MTQEFIYHIISEEDWKNVSKKESYSPDSLSSEGFIHFSMSDQVNEVVKRYYKEVDDLMLLKVEISKLQSNLKFESVVNYGIYPHLYSELKLENVVGVYRIQKNDDGDYFWLE
jgi:uncharacterized protein (DUF952 family)